MENRKIGILTFHNARNYGAVLQAYALWKKLTELNNYVEIIDYHNCKIDEAIKLWHCTEVNLKSVIQSTVKFFYRVRKKISFATFIKKHLLLSEYVDKENIGAYTKKFDLLIAGSDQVWNVELTGNDTVYFLDFVDDRCLKAAYAVSFGDTGVELPDKIKGLLQDFDLLTLREDNMKQVVDDIVGYNVEICCDPCFLLSAAEWRRIASKKPEKEKYIFVFMIEDSPGILKYAKKLASEKNLKIISNKNCFSFIKRPSPDDFLAWIYNAEYVLTDSFHGTVFSIIFQKQFLCSTVNNEGKEKTRITHLLKLFGLEHRILGECEENLYTEENWREIDMKMNAYKEAALHYLKKMDG